MVHDNIELIDNEYFRIPIYRPSKKIKFKKISFENIFNRWNNFRLNRLKSKLSAKKDRLVGMEFSDDQLAPGKARDFTEKRILMKTKAIARLESKINFLETGEYLSEEFVSSRAIKLKSTMMNNLVYNKDAAYSITEEAAEEIYADGDEIDQIIDEQRAAISEKVKKIMEEKNNGSTTPETKTGPDAKTGSDSNDEESETIVSRDELEGVVTEKMAGIDLSSTVTNEETAEAIESEMDKIKVNNNENSSKVNKFINEDGTYHLTKYDIDEEFRINKFDRKQLPTDVAVMPTEPPITPFEPPTKRKYPDVESPKKAITDFSTVKMPFSFDKPPVPTIKKVDGTADFTSEKRDLPIVVEERENIDAGSHTNNESNRDVDAVLERVKLLLAERRTIGTKLEEAAIRKGQVEETYEKTYDELVAFADSLEETCNESLEMLNQDNKESAIKEATIEKMLAMMSAGSASSVSEEQIGRRK